MAAPVPIAPPPDAVGAARRRRLTQLYTEPGVTATNLGDTARLAARTLGFPIVQINVLDDDFQYRMIDWDADPLQMAERNSHPAVVPRRMTMCQYTIEAGRTLSVDDLQAEQPYSDLEGVRQGFARAYLGVPVRSRESQIIGSLCVMDHEPRCITADEARMLADYARVVEDQLDLVRRARESRSISADAAAELTLAIADGQIVPWYQPVVDLDTGQTRSYEALARWVHPDGRIEDPGRFVPLAEDGNLVVELDLAIARAAVADLARWLAEGRDFGVHVNISPLHLELDGGPAAIHRVVADAGVDPARVTLELTESRKLVDVERAARAVGDLRAYGFPVVLDDFGTGWSALDWIMTLPVTGLKIDRSVACALDSRVGQAVTRAATGLASDLGLSLILEGVSSAAHVARARESGYRLGQGFFWSRAVPAAAIAG